MSVYTNNASQNIRDILLPRPAYQESTPIDTKVPNLRQWLSNRVYKQNVMATAPAREPLSAQTKDNCGNLAANDKLNGSAEVHNFDMVLPPIPIMSTLTSEWPYSRSEVTRCPPGFEKMFRDVEVLERTTNTILKAQVYNEEKLTTQSPPEMCLLHKRLMEVAGHKWHKCKRKSIIRVPPVPGWFHDEGMQKLNGTTPQRTWHNFLPLEERWINFGPDTFGQAIHINGGLKVGTILQEGKPNDQQIVNNQVVESSPSVSDPSDTYGGLDNIENMAPGSVERQALTNSAIYTKPVYPKLFNFDASNRYPSLVREDASTIFKRAFRGDITEEAVDNVEIYMVEDEPLIHEENRMAVSYILDNDPSFAHVSPGDDIDQDRLLKPPLKSDPPIPTINSISNLNKFGKAQPEPIQETKDTLSCTARESDTDEDYDIDDDYDEDCLDECPAEYLDSKRWDLLKDYHVSLDTKPRESLITPRRQEIDTRFYDHLQTKSVFSHKGNKSRRSWWETDSEGRTSLVALASDCNCNCNCHNSTPGHDLKISNSSC